MQSRYLVAQGQRRVLGIQDPSRVYSGEVPSEPGTAAVAPATEPTPLAQQYVGSLTVTQLNELAPWLLAVSLDSTGNTDLGAGWLAADVIKIHDGDDSHELSIVWNEAETTANRTLNFLVHAGNRTIDLYENFKVLNGQDIELHASGGEKAQLAIDTQNAERTLDLTGNLTLGANFITSGGHALTLTTTAITNVTLPTAGTLIARELFDADTFLYASSDNTPVATSPANVMAALSGHAAAAFSFNSQNLTSGGTIGCTAVSITGARPLTLSGGTTAITKKGPAGAWAFGFHAVGSGDTNRGGFGFLGAADALTKYYIGTAYNDAAVEITAAGNLDITKHNLSTVGLHLAGTLVTTSAAELNLSDGGTAAGGSMMTAADAAAQLALLSGNAGAVFDFNAQNVQNIGYLRVGGSAGGSGTAGDIVARRSATTGAYYFGENAAKYLYFDATNFLFGGGGVNIVVHDAATVGLKLGGTLVTSGAAELNLNDGSVAGTIVNSKAVIYGASGEVNATTLEIAGNLLNISTDGTDTTVVGALNITALAGADPATHKAVYYNTTTKSLFYDNT